MHREITNVHRTKMKNGKILRTIAFYEAKGKWICSVSPACVAVYLAQSFKLLHNFLRRSVVFKSIRQGEFHIRPFTKPCEFSITRVVLFTTAINQSKIAELNYSYLIILF